ncbi:ATP-binding protein [Flammeovirga pectinis]|uniref:ATP-binding protein n=1 Tax=Flammeovirga pectinis TaxID=2494373 RepID=A0A3S9P378_9BACT|nr:ATP-binding protein [Flammeovirga pectinis]AZQ62655.1 ATP-binding protein [Flammeovirga pectinis]
MNEYQLQKLIQNGESKTLEFKLKVTKPTRFAKTLSSIANTKGGILLVGVNDQQEIIGIDPFKEQNAIEEILKHHITPTLVINFVTIETDNGIVLLLEIPNSPLKPHKALSREGKWITHIRYNDKSIEMSNKSIKLATNEQISEPVKLKRKFTKQETSLLDFLSENEKITLKQFCQLVNFSERRARRILHELTVIGLLQEHSIEKDIFYSLG